jgi:hypothetical protein
MMMNTTNSHLHEENLEYIGLSRSHGILLVARWQVMQDYGYAILNALVTDLDPDVKVRGIASLGGDPRKHSRCFSFLCEDGEFA